MDFSHYSDQPVALAVDLVNTDQRFSGEEEIPDLVSLQVFLEPYRELWESAGKELRSADLEAVHRLRESLREVFEAPDDETASRLVNSILASHGAAPRVSVHSGHPHLHFEPIDSSVPAWLGAITAMGLATVIVEHGVDRFGVCEASNCLDVYVDTSRNRSRRHCSTTCSTREAVAAYRRRQAH